MWGLVQTLFSNISWLAAPLGVLGFFVDPDVVSFSEAWFQRQEMDTINDRTSGYIQPLCEEGKSAAVRWSTELPSSPSPTPHTPRRTERARTDRTVTECWITKRIKKQLNKSGTRCARHVTAPHFGTPRTGTPWSRQLVGASVPSNP